MYYESSPPFYYDFGRAIPTSRTPSILKTPSHTLDLSLFGSHEHVESFLFPDSGFGSVARIYNRINRQRIQPFPDRPLQFRHGALPEIRPADGALEQGVAHEYSVVAQQAYPPW